MLSWNKFPQKFGKAKTILLENGRRLLFFLYIVFPLQSIIWSTCAIPSTYHQINVSKRKMSGKNI